MDFLRLDKSLDVDIQRFIQMFGYIFAVFPALPDTFREEILDLSVDRAEIVLRPGGDIVIQLFREPERNLFLFLFIHKQHFRLK